MIMHNKTSDIDETVMPFDFSKSQNITINMDNTDETESDEDDDLVGTYT